MKIVIAGPNEVMSKMVREWADTLDRGEDVDVLVRANEVGCSDLQLRLTREGPAERLAAEDWTEPIVEYPPYT